MTAVGDVELEWGVRRSFLAYVERLPDGIVRTTGAAVRDGDVFRLPGRRLADGTYAFEGALHFFGHAGVLDVVLDGLRIDDDMLTAAVSGVRTAIAALDGGAASVDPTVSRFDAVTLTDDGAALLGGVYPPGAPADPLAIRLAAIVAH